ncbi:MAG: C4-type zinc ribbon domain-containing protein [Actinomycetota bacterium]
MASPAYELILEVQALDLSIEQLRHQAANHPDRERLNEIDARLAAHDAEAAEVEAARHELERQRKRLEDEVATIQARRVEIDGKLYGGEVTASKELLALQDEADSLLTKQTALEDDELELMEQLEERTGDLSSRAETRAGIEAERATVQSGLDAAVATIEAQIGEIDQQRSTKASPEPGAVQGWSDLIGHYDELRAQYDGVPVARLVGSRCDGCHIQLSAVAVDQLSKMPDDAVVTCEECGRLLVR